MPSTFNYRIECGDKGYSFNVVQLNEITKFLKTIVPALASTPDIGEGMQALAAIKGLLQEA